MLEHGGSLIGASQRYGVPADGWLDLSTGINPHAWWGAPPSRASWQRLPEDQDGLIDAARDYYAAPHVLPVPGTQAAIQLLPHLRDACRVGVVEPGYAEHAHRWRTAGHLVSALRSENLNKASDDFDVLLLCNPNNPTGARYSSAQLLELHARLSARGGWLIVDEAFIDASPEESVAAHTGREGMTVLRSFGKFFGLAGARVGFVLAWPELLKRLAECIGPWAVNGPARLLARDALADRAWQSATRSRLHVDSDRLAAMLHAYGLRTAGGCELFHWVRTQHAAVFYQALALEGVLVRRFDSPASLRFGLPGSERDWSRLNAALATVTRAGLAA